MNAKHEFSKKRKVISLLFYEIYEVNKLFLSYILFMQPIVLNIQGLLYNIFQSCLDSICLFNMVQLEHSLPQKLQTCIDIDIADMPQVDLSFKTKSA